MSIFVEIKTDLRVSEMIKYFQDREGWTILHEIDSVNCGEGYDMRYYSVSVRLYDDERSDAVMAHPDFRPYKNWDEIFEKVRKEFIGKSHLTFIIDSNDCSTEAENKTLEAIQIIAQEHGLIVTEIDK